MKSANKEILSSFFTNNYQYMIPFFQRSYVWSEENWQLFWENIEEELESFNRQEKSEHFIGTIITKQLTSDNFSTQPMELIDGQQRLTTVSLILKAIADTADGTYPKLKEQTDQLIKFQDTKGDTFLRLRHSKIDSKYFDAVMLGRDFSDLDNKHHPIILGYQFFKNRLKDFSDEQRDNLKNMLLNRFPVISMLLEERDDEQEIFDTINSLGVRLTIGELLKNYIFRDEELKEHYQEHWYKVFEADESTIQFWETTKTAGRVQRTNLELLLYCFLIIETGSEVRLEKLYKEYKKYLKDRSNDEKIAFLVNLKNYAADYQQFPAGTELNEISFSEHEKRLFHIIEYLEITTVYPLLLFLYRQVQDAAEKEKCLLLLESYLVRRMVCKLTSKNYNRLFIGLINNLKKVARLDYNAFEECIKDFSEDTNRMPDDDEFRRGFLDSYLYNKYAREVLYCIALYQLDNNYSDVRKLSAQSYSVEHMMPKKWEENWLDKDMTEAEKDIRHRKLKTLGNLTLVTKALNSKLKNFAWANKRSILKEYSLLTLTSKYLELEEWDEDQISARGDTLAELALKIWRR
ncbi:DUF262 domain-containing protein [Lewinella sp. LCG006]|uniref:DUF262 domain-containing protein n=1 Tax=Lewinella sp. LCG006 TaxID=3231911 RepID=UPI00345F2451